MKSSDLIAAFLLEALEKQDGALELQRNELAQRFNVVPSQINYVISSRFTPERGYIIESRRGGGGYIRITKKAFDKNQYVMHLFFGIGDSIDAKTCVTCLNNLYAEEIITAREAAIMNAALGLAITDTARAEVLKRMLLVIMK